MPKALVRAADDTPWVELGTRALLDGGCSEVVVVLGAAAGTAGTPCRTTWCADRRRPGLGHRARCLARRRAPGARRGDRGVRLARRPADAAGRGRPAGPREGGRPGRAVPRGLRWPSRPPGAGRSRPPRCARRGGHVRPDGPRRRRLAPACRRRRLSTARTSGTAPTATVPIVPTHRAWSRKPIRASKAVPPCLLRADRHATRGSARHARSAPVTRRAVVSTGRTGGAVPAGTAPPVRDR